LRKMDVLLTHETGVPAYVAERPMDCTALGASRALAEYQILRRTIPVTP
jgi:rod shape-determining protein MreB